VEDLYKWDQALYTEQLLPKEAFRRMFTPFKDDYAFGWFVRKIDGREVIGHAGGINGFATDIKRVPSTKTVAIALSNVLPSQPGKLTDDLLAIVDGKTPAKPALHQEIKLDESILRQYVGEYVLSPDAVLSVTLESGGLHAQLTGQPKLPIFAESETRFFLKVVDAVLEFQKDAAGHVTSVVLEQSGKHVLPRKQ